MKIKIKKIKSSADLTERLYGVGIFRLTGPCLRTGERRVLKFEGTRPEAELFAKKVFR
jgi:hypothetical protein